MCIKTIAAAVILTMQLHCIERRRAPTEELVAFIAPPKIKTEKIEKNVRELFDVEVELTGADLHMLSDHWLTVRSTGSVCCLERWSENTGESSIPKIKITEVPTVMSFEDLFYSEELQANLVAEISVKTNDRHVTTSPTDSIPISIVAQAGGIKTDFKVSDKKDSVTMHVMEAKPNTTYDVIVALSLEGYSREKVINKHENSKVTTNKDGQAQLVLAEKIDPDNNCIIYLKSRFSTDDHGEVPSGGEVSLPCLRGDGGEVTVNAQGNVGFSLSSTENKKLMASNDKVYIEFSYLEYEKYGDSSTCGGFRTYQIANNFNIGTIENYRQDACYYVEVNVYDNSATASACANIDGGSYSTGTTLLNDIIEPPDLTITRKVGNC